MGLRAGRTVTCCICHFGIAVHVAQEGKPANQIIEPSCPTWLSLFCAIGLTRFLCTGVCGMGDAPIHLDRLR